MQRRSDRSARVMGLVALGLTACAENDENTFGGAPGGELPTEPSSADAAPSPMGPPGSTGGAWGQPAGTGAAAAAGDDAPPRADASPNSRDAGGEPQANDAAATDAITPATGPSTGPGDWGPGDYPPDITGQTYLEISGVPGQNGITRQYKVHVPPSYDPDVPAPLVFCIHGLSQNAVMFCVQGAALHEKSDEAGFILVMPNGHQNSWNGGTCCGGASAEQLDDVALFRAIFDEVGQHVNVDLGRVYATGLSNGGFMSFRLACEAADLFAAVAPNAGAVGTNDMGGGTNPASDFSDCTPSEPVSVLALHGTADGLVPYALHAPSLARIAEQDGCSTSTSAATQPLSGGDTTCVTQSGCPNGIEVTGCTVEGGGHCWFGSPDCGTGGGPIGSLVVGANSDTLINNDAIWEFFERIRKF